VVNVDISHSCFWHEASIVQLGFQMSGLHSQESFIQGCVPKPDGTPGYVFPLLKRLVKNNFIVKHRGQAVGAGKSPQVL